MITKLLILGIGSLLVVLMALGLHFLRPAPLPQLGEIAPFQLVDQSGKPFGSEQLRDQVWVANFIFTSCAGVCPLLTRKMGEVQDFLAKRKLDGVKLVSISVDPETDTPERLASYAESFQADSERWHFLTGSEPAVEDLVVKGFRISMGKVSAAVGFEVVHGERFVLVGRLGRIRSYYQSDEKSLRQLRRDLVHLTKEK